ncbi:MAG TPA: hypothetical protein VFZ83_11405, partial [Acidimicrobiia bacterium]|nr:hypothetical protein [Acidimicrobiia bacterium]
MSARTTSATVARERRIAVRLGLVVLVLLGPVVARHDASSWSRTALTAALWDEHTIDVTSYPLGIDRVVHDAEYRSDKAPGQPFLAVPFYAAYRALGGEPAVIERAQENLGLWWQTLWTSTIP